MKCDCVADSTESSMACSFLCVHVCERECTGLSPCQVRYKKVCVGVSLEIWWCYRTEGKYLHSTKGLRTIKKTNKYLPLAGRKRISREHSPGVSKKQVSKEDWFWTHSKVLKKSTINSRPRVGQRERMEEDMPESEWYCQKVRKLEKSKREQDKQLWISSSQVSAR